VTDSRQFVVSPDPRHGGRSALSEFLAQHGDRTMTVNITDGMPKKRGLTANGLQAVWIKTVAAEQGDSEYNVRLFVKTELALPVMRYDVETDSERDRALKINYILRKIGYDLLLDYQRLSAMESFNVTSVLSPRQHKVFRDQMHRHYLQEGIVLASLKEAENA